MTVGQAPAAAEPPGSPPPRRGRGRPPGPNERVRAQVLEAALAELVDHGYADFRIDRVAERAEVSKTTIYRRWGNRATLSQAAINYWHRAQMRRIDTGSWLGDLRALCRTLADLEQSPTALALLRTLVAANVVDAELTSSLLELLDADAQILTEPIERARLRGDIRPDVEPATIIAMISGPMVARSIVTALPIDDAFVETIAAVIHAGTVNGSTGAND